MSENKEKSVIQKQIVDLVMASSQHGLLNLAPRVGKTKIAIDILKKMKPKSILWVTPNTKLRDVDIPGEFVTWKATSYLKKTDIICWASLAKVKGEYDIIILDEYQDITEGSSKHLINGELKYGKILGLSGTHPKHEEKQEIYDKLGLDILVAMSIDEATEAGLIADYHINVVHTSMNSKNKVIKAGSKTKPFMITEKAAYEYITKQINYIYYRGESVPSYLYIRRLRQVYDSPSKVAAAKLLISKLEGRTLIFCASIAQSEELCEYTYNSKTSPDDLSDFMNKKIDKLACVNAGGVGYTFRDVDNLVIVQVNSDRKGNTTQKLARALVLQEGYKANIYIICLDETPDERWIEATLEGFDKEKVSHQTIRSYA